MSRDRDCRAQRIARIAGIVALGAGLFGCGQEAPHAAAPATPPVDACTLLTAADVATVTKDVEGSLSSTLEDAVGKDPALCTYALSGNPPKAISLAVRRQTGVDAAVEQHQTAAAGFRSLGASVPVEDVAGLADGAFWAGGQIDQLHIRRGDTLLILTVQLDPQPLAAARALAGRVLTRLAHPPAPGKPAAPGKAPAPGSPPLAATPKEPA